MNTHDGQPVYRELICGENISYVLNENALFSSTEYKVLRSRNNDCFLFCCKMLLNGNIQLYYLTDNCIPLSKAVEVCDADTLLGVVEDLIAAVISVMNNGFLSYQNISISLNQIYVETNAQRVRLVYLPLNIKLFPDLTQFRRARYGVLRQIAELRPELREVLSAYIKRCSLEPEQLPIRAFHPYRMAAEREKKAVGVRADKVFSLIAVNAPYPLELRVSGEEYTIGRNESVVNGFVPFSRMVGRIHCKLCCVDGGYAVMDLGSANGTYLNNSKLQPNRLYPLQNGDIVRMANAAFKVCVLQEYQDE